MSIYPVPLQEWFPKGDENHEVVKAIVAIERCAHCGKYLKFKKAWGHHSLPWGYGDVWCDEVCCNEPWKRKRRARRFKKCRGKRKKWLFGGTGAL